MKSENVIIMIVILIVLSSIILGFVYADSEYHRGFEAGKNYVPASMKRADSLSVVYYGNMPMVSDHVKMPRDSVQLIIDGIMGKPKQYLLMTLKLVTKEKE